MQGAVARGDRCWFIVDSKSFIRQKLGWGGVAGGELRAVIEERGRGLSTWIRFGDLSLRCLLEGVEICCRDEDLMRWSKAWEKGRRKFKLEHRSNKAGSFSFCLMVTDEAKRFLLIFLERRGFHRGGQLWRRSFVV